MIRTSYIALGLLTLLGNVFANIPDTLELAEVSVSVIPFQEEIDRTAASYVSIDLSGLNSRQVINNAEILNQAPGLFMATASYSTNRLTIRGIGSRTPYNTNRIKIFLDDIPLTSGDGVSSVEDIDAYGIGMINIVKGPSSALYGSGLGGVIRLNSKYPLNPGLSISLDNELGSFSTYRNNLSLAFKKNRFSIHGGYSRSSAAGFRQNSTYRRHNVYMNGRYFGEKTNLSATFRFVDLYAEIPSSLDLDDFTLEPEKAADNWLNIQGFEEDTRILAGLSIESRFSRKITNILTVHSAVRDPFERRPFNTLDDLSFNVGLRESLSFETDKFKISCGAEFYRERYNWSIFETLDVGMGAILNSNREWRQYLNVFSYLQWRPTDRLLVEGGVNLHSLSYDLYNSYSRSSINSSGSYTYPAALSPKMGINLEYLSSHFFYTSIGHGFSAPSVEETLLPDGEINRELKPETGWNAEIGSRGYFLNKRIHYDLTFYSILLRNMLVTERVAEDIFTGINAGSAVNSGMEFLTTVNLAHPQLEPAYELDFILGLSASKNKFLDFTDDGVVHDGNSLPGIPGQILHATLMGGYKNVQSRFQYRYTGAQWMNDENTELYTDYHLLQWQFSWTHQFSGTPFEFELHVGVRNLLNTQYASMILVNARSFGGADPRYYYPGLPRHLHAGISVRFN